MPSSFNGCGDMRMLANRQMNALREATADAVEQASINSMLAAAAMTGFQVRTVYGLDAEWLRDAASAQLP